MVPAFASLRPRSSFRILAVIVLFFLLQQLLHFRKPVPVPGRETAISLEDRESSCGSLEGIDDLYVVLRTGVTEAPRKLPAHFATTLRCIPHYVVYSDFEEVIDGHHVYDALDEIDEGVMATHPDFEYYNRFKGRGREAFSAQEIAQWSAARNTNSGRDSPGWRLDKWKFLPLAEKALRNRPEAKWYVFIESDTYILWKNLLEWLSHFDPSKPHYMGQQMQIGDVVFAYGGAGFAISNPALKKVVEHRNANLKFYDDFTGGHWAGDCVLGKALLDSGVPLQWAFPTVAGDEPKDMDFNSPFGGSDKQPWCYYATSYHHLPPSEYPVFYNFEQKWNQENSTLRHSDVFKYYVLPDIKPERAEWDNMSDTEQDSNSSFEECRAICENEPECRQFSLFGKSCRTSTAVKLGRETSSAPTEKVTSGWIMDRVEAYIEDLDSNCGNRGWVL